MDTKPGFGPELSPRSGENRVNRFVQIPDNGRRAAVPRSLESSKPGIIKPWLTLEMPMVCLIEQPACTEYAPVEGPSRAGLTGFIGLGHSAARGFGPIERSYWDRIGGACNCCQRSLDHRPAFLAMAKNRLRWASKSCHRCGLGVWIGGLESAWLMVV